MTATERTLTVLCPSGLCNRLRVLLSGLALAEATGRRFTILWPRTKECAASFCELFANRLNVEEQDWPGLPVYGEGDRATKPDDLLLSLEPHLLVASYGWLFRPALYPAHNELLRRCSALMNTLQPIAEITDRVQEFRAAHFCSAMIGVHLRRGDFRRLESRDTRVVMEWVDVFLARSPGAGIFLSTDDGAVNQRTGKPTQAEGLRERFRREYGARVVFTQPRSLDRRQPDAVQDALVDLLLLRATDYVVGTKNSSFSAMAAFGRTVPAVSCGESDPFRAKKLLATVSGVYPLLKLIGFLQHRERLSYPYLAQYYGRRLRKTLHS